MLISNRIQDIYCELAGAGPHFGYCETIGLPAELIEKPDENAGHHGPESRVNVAGCVVIPGSTDLQALGVVVTVFRMVQS
jgi:hypothetical protein